MPTYFKYLLYRRRGNFSAFPANGAFLELNEPVQLTLARLPGIWITRLHKVHPNVRKDKDSVELIASEHKQVVDILIDC